jgi:hypothetical protein
MPFPKFAVKGNKSDLSAFPAMKRRKDNPQATKNQKKMRAGNTIDTGPSNKFFKKLGGV